MLLLTSGFGAIHVSSSRRPGSAIFVQYGRVPDLAPLRNSSLELENPPLGHLLTGGPRVNPLMLAERASQYPVIVSPSFTEQLRVWSHVPPPFRYSEQHPRHRAHQVRRPGHGDQWRRVDRQSVVD